MSPQITFTVTSTTLVVDTNEDGFKRRNVEAICSTGKSSKKAKVSDNHIGEKGFGFKSVFSVADDVHVQSGIWSFRFRHSRGENGLGMVTPLDAPFENLPNNVTTRITLRFSETTTNEHERLLNEIDSIPETIILHLHNLRQIVRQRPDQRVSIVGSDIPESRYAGSTRKNIRTERMINGSTSTENSYFYSFSKHITLPQDERREGRSDSVIALDFPVRDFVSRKPANPMVDQHVLAFLPLYQLPIKVCVAQNLTLYRNKV